MNSIFLQRSRIIFKISCTAFIFVLLYKPQNCVAQKVKDYVLDVQYQAVPPYPLHVERVSYITHTTEEYITASNEIKTLDTWSTKYTERSAFYAANFPHFGLFYYSKKDVENMYQADMNIGLLSLENKTMKAIGRTNNNPAAPATTNAFVYELTYNLPFDVTLKNAKDSVIFNEKAIFQKPIVMIFPDDFQNLVPNYTAIVLQPQLEEAWLKYQMKVVVDAKDKIIANHLNQFTKILSKRHEELKGNLGFEFYYLKDRKEEFPAFDSALAIMKIVCDSIKQNLKAKNYRNWHTKFVMDQTKIVDKIINGLATEYKTKLDNGTMDKELAEEIVFGLVKNKYAVMMLQNRYEEAIAEIEVYLSIGIFHKYLSKTYLEKTLSMFKDEQRRYLANKKYYKWN